MQLAVDVSIPEVFGGVGGEAIFIGNDNALNCAGAGVLFAISLWPL